MSETIVSKKCCTCKEIKPLSEFSKNKSAKDGRQTACKICQKHYRQSDVSKIIHRRAAKKYFQTEKGRRKKIKDDQKYRQSENGKFVIKEYFRSEKGKASIRRYQRSEKGKAASQKYAKLNPEKRKAKTAVMVAVKYGELPRPDTFKCECGKQAQHYHHHSYAPEHWFDVIPLCAKCHRNIPLMSASVV